MKLKENSFDLQLFGDSEGTGTDDTTSDTDDKGQDATTDKPDLSSLQREIQELRATFTSPEFIASLRGDSTSKDSKDEGKSKLEVTPEIESIIDLAAQRAEKIILNREAERQVAVAMKAHPDFVDYKDSMIIISNANPEWSVDKVYQEAKSYAEFKKSKTSDSQKEKKPLAGGEKPGNTSLMKESKSGSISDVVAEQMEKLNIGG